MWHANRSILHWTRRTPPPLIYHLQYLQYRSLILPFGVGNLFYTETRMNVKASIYVRLSLNCHVIVRWLL